MPWFKNTTSPEEVKKEYRKLAMANHPDRGGSNEAMESINTEYQRILKTLDGHTSDGHTYFYKESNEQALSNMIDCLIRLRMIKVEINLIGTWIWITGETHTHKDTLKEMDCKWHSKRRSWYWHIKTTRPHKYNNRASLDEIAQKYGVKTFSQPTPPQLN